MYFFKEAKIELILTTKASFLPHKEC